MILGSLELCKINLIRNDSEVVSSDDDFSDSSSGSDQESIVNIDEEELFISDDFVKYNTVTADETERLELVFLC